MNKSLKNIGLIILLFVLGFGRLRAQGNVMDTVKLNRLASAYKTLNLAGNEFLISGKIMAKNGADTAQRLDNATYVFSRKGASFYFKLGTTETINAHGLYLYVDHKMKKVLLAKEKKVVSNFAMPDLSTILKSVKEEGFKLSSTSTKETERISLTNPYHLSCKEYAVSFNKKTLKPNRLFMRLSDGYAPENPKKDNVIDFRIGLSSPVSAIEKYTVQTIVRKENNRWKLNPAFKNYELINTL